MRSFVSAFGSEPNIQTSNQSLIHFEGTNPADIGTPGSPNVIATPAKNMSQTDSIAFRMLLQAGWGLRIPGAAAWVQGITAW
jgi:hypothetical protein